MNFRAVLAMLVCKALRLVSRILHRGGTAMPGRIALKIYPELLSLLAKDVKTVAVTGTNGKTTSSRMIEQAFLEQGKSYFANRSGANLISGITTEFVINSSLSGKCRKEYAVIECDEAAARKVFSQLRPQVIVVTNLFRDQLDRYGEIDITMNILEEMIRTVPDMKLIVNGDDALSAYMAMDSGNPCVYYGISRPVMKNETNEIREGRFCKKCGERLQYSFYHYSQLGDYQCPRCGFKRPVPDYDAEDVKVSDQLSFSVEGNRIVANYRGFYNVYNILAAYAGIRTAGFKAEHFMDMLKNFNPENGRMEQFRIKGAGVTLNLAKNPAGFNQNISAVMQDTNPKDVIIAINDNAQDGIDISWLWDVDFDRLGEESIRSITVSGIRCQDMRLRLKYVDIPSILESDVEKAIRDRVADGTGNLYVLVNYTALFSTRNILKKLEGEH